ncbi:hypothetical protein GCM10023201_27420 [Actinomycetospora corticicola]|uniref:Uncharacterized protein n=1 Tax=Actinomycetospora corticicola TaxID=663602 RepID=A0A7Y9DX95_9PSEU|nr:hypothetical protein [Actinomycetospora corticicola]NYD37125.1 hypothetical protein [Actinomycetospora corticicola]
MRAVLRALSCPDEPSAVSTGGGAPPEVVPAHGSDGRAATAAALYATADALVQADVAEVAEAVYDLAVDLDVVVTALGPAWFRAEPADRPLLVLRRLVRRSIDPEAPDLVVPRGPVVGTRHDPEVPGGRTQPST